METRNKSKLLSLSRPKKTLLALAIAQCFSVASANGATIVVDTQEDDGDNCSLRNAVTSINMGVLQGDCENAGDGFGNQDSINFAADLDMVYLREQLFINQSVEISDEKITLQGKGTERLFELQSATVNLRGLTITGGVADQGGAIKVELGASLNIFDSTISGNSASQNGGGIHLSDGEVNLNNSIVENNTAGLQGGGIFVQSTGFVSDGLIRQNMADYGGGVACSSEASLYSLEVSNNNAVGRGGGITLQDVCSLDAGVVTNNSSQYGAGLFVADSASVNDVLINDNTAVLYGGGFVAIGEAELSGLRVIDNEADQGAGGVLMQSASLLNSKVLDNSASETGGGLRFQEFDSLVNNVQVIDSTISGNSAGDKGGGIYSATNVQLYSRSEIIRSTISNNESVEGGGGVHASSGLTISNSTISGNSTSSRIGAGAGGVFAGEFSFIRNSTIVDNTARYATGGVMLSGFSGISSSIVSGNIFSGSPNFASYFYTDLYARDSQTTVTENIIGSSASTSLRSFYIQEQHIAANIILTSDSGTPTPLNRIVSELAYNGGPTQSHALSFNSPAINTGSDAVCASNIIDQRGVARPIGPACDIGAFESPFGEPTDFFVIPTKNGRTVIIEL